MIIGFYWDDDQFITNFPPDIDTDANGDADLAGVDLIDDQPHRIGGYFYEDTNDSNRWDEGEAVLANLIMTIDQPCTGAEASPK